MDPEDQARAEPGTVKGPGESSVEESEGRQYVTFMVGEEHFGFPMERVREVVRSPGVTPVPLAPPALRGLANLRGQVVPVFAAADLLGLSGDAETDLARVVVIDGHSPTGFQVDRMAQVLEAGAGEIGTVEGIDSAIDRDLLAGVVQERDGEGMVFLLDPGAVLTKGSGGWGDDTGGTAGAGSAVQGAAARAEGSGQAEPETQLVGVRLEDQEYALPVEHVEEIVRAPANISEVPRSEAHVLGLMQLRERPLPLVGLRELLGLPPKTPTPEDRVVVVGLGGEGHHATVGLVVDGVREVLRLPESHLEPVPPFLATEGGIEELEALVRLHEGRRLVSVLSVDRLFELEGLREAMAAQQEADAGSAAEGGSGMDGPGEAAGDVGAEEVQMVVFRLARDEFAARIENVREITRLPDNLTRVPHAPDFIEGVINLRGRVLPVINLRRRFGLTEAERDSRQRIVVLRINGEDMGLLVDSVSEVLKVPAREVQPTPRLTEFQKRLLGEMVKLSEQKRLILILTPDELVTAQEIAEIQEAAQ